MKKILVFACLSAFTSIAAGDLVCRGFDKIRGQMKISGTDQYASNILALSCSPPGSHERVSFEGLLISPDQPAVSETRSDCSTVGSCIEKTLAGGELMELSLILRSPLKPIYIAGRNNEAFPFLIEAKCDTKRDFEFDEKAGKGQALVPSHQCFRAVKCWLEGRNEQAIQQAICDKNLCGNKDNAKACFLQSMGLKTPINFRTDTGDLPAAIQQRGKTL